MEEITPQIKVLIENIEDNKIFNIPGLGIRKMVT